MFYSETILSRRGPLGKVWLAAHMERKLSKTQFLQTDIEQSVDAIMGQDIEFMALRLSGQLLLGVVRIYSRKAKYLLDDCNEALLKIKMAFRPGLVDMTEDQLVVNKNTITLQNTATADIDFLLPNYDWEVDFVERPLPAQGHHQANIADITLRTADDFLPFDANDPFNIGPSDGIGSQDFAGEFDLGIDWGDGAGNETRDEDGLSVDDSVGVGRDAGHFNESIGNQFNRGNMDIDMDLDLLSHHSKSRDASEHPFGADMDIDLPDFGGMDLGEMGIGFDLPPSDPVGTPGQTRSPSRASSPLTEPPATPPPDVELNGLPTPVASKMKRKIKEKKQIIDSVTELEDGPRGKGRGRAGLDVPVNKDVSDILTEPHFLPRSTVVMRLLEIHNDPLAHFLPTKVTPNGSFFCAAPPGLAPELAEMFMRPVHSLNSKRRATSPGKGPNKRQRLDGSVHGDDELEQARRAASLAPSLGVGTDILGRGSVGPDMGLDFADQSGALDDYQLDVPEFDVGMDLDGRGKTPGTDRSRMSTPAADGGLLDDGEETYADATCPIAMFDSRPQTQTQTQGTEKEVEADPADTEGKGYSKNTVKALAVIRRDLKPVDGDDVEEKVLSFRKMSDKASRRAAASFFFELLVLGTRDCVTLSQAEPFENIEVRAKDKLWERQRHGSAVPSRFASVAPSYAGSAAPSRAPSVARSLASSLGL